jgi:hypothetical protein
MKDPAGVNHANCQGAARSPPDNERLSRDIHAKDQEGEVSLIPADMKAWTFVC